MAEQQKEAQRISAHDRTEIEFGVNENLNPKAARSSEKALAGDLVTTAEPTTNASPFIQGEAQDTPQYNPLRYTNTELAQGQGEEQTPPAQGAQTREESPNARLQKGLDQQNDAEVGHTRPQETAGVHEANETQQIVKPRESAGQQDPATAQRNEENVKAEQEEAPKFNAEKPEGTRLDDLERAVAEADAETIRRAQENDKRSGAAKVYEARLAELEG